MTQPIDWYGALTTYSAGPAPYWLISNAQEQLLDLEEALERAAEKPTGNDSIDIDDEMEIDL
ncbi:hypothetical protein [Streptomyces sp. RLA2-12]|uniref:hypothetical protein n=1 Tax=Streptomyces sp. RLA2-12 TaxID=2721242 RepID=UPI00145DD283|nr:hypothetical protein [Streptomyces sp. RLA2-12]NMI63147.1 hypothetical protein [Streptomyces sp. RLA2-12]